MPIPLKSPLSRTLACAAAFPLCMALVSCADDADTSADPSEPQFSDAVAQSSSSSEEQTAATTTNSPATPPVETPAQQPATQAKGDCSPASFAPLAPDMTNIVVLDCDGAWAHFGQDQTDWLVWARFSDGEWTTIRPIGEATSGMSEPCYDVDKWINQGAPSFVADDMRRCN